MQFLKCLYNRFQDRNHVCQHCVKPSQTLFLVYHLGIHSSVVKLKVISRPYQVSDIGLFIDTEELIGGMGEYYKTKHSLRDINIIPNNYNQHRVFRYGFDAKTYLLSHRGGIK